LPKKLANYSVFARGGNELLGLATCTPPNIQNLQDTYKGAGVFGEMNVPIQAHFQAMEVSLEWNLPSEETARLVMQDGTDLDIWMAHQWVNTADNKIVHRGWRLQMLTMPSGLEWGSIEVGTSMTSVTTLQVTRFVAYFDDVEQIKIDQDNQECVIYGQDFAQRIRQLIGKNN
jgi:phage tail tube protein FII